MRKRTPCHSVYHGNQIWTNGGLTIQTGSYRQRIMTHQCFGPMEGEKAAFFRKLYDIQFHGECSKATTKPIPSSGWAADIQYVVDGLKYAYETGVPARDAYQEAFCRRQKRHLLLRIKRCHELLFPKHDKLRRQSRARLVRLVYDRRI